MSTDGLTLREAFAQAEAEEAAAADSPNSADEGLQPSNVNEGEQPNVEDQGPTRLFREMDPYRQPSEQPVNMDSLVEVEVDGKTVEVTFDELRNGYMRQADYTQKTPELAVERRQHENAVTLYQALQDNPAATLRILSQRISKPGGGLQDGFSFGSGGTTGGSWGTTNVSTTVSENSDIQSIVKQAVQEALNNDPRIQSYESQQAFNAINHVFGAIEKEFTVSLTDDDKEVVLRKADELGTTDLRFVFAGLLREQEQRDKQLQNLEGVSTSRGIGRSKDESAPPVFDATDFRAIWHALEDQEL